MVEHLHYVAREENIEASAEALNVIARKADGAMRDALSIFDQVAASSMGKITYQSALANLNVLDYDYYFRLVEAFRAGDVGQSLLIYNEIQDRGFDTLFFINGLASHIRDLMVAADQRTVKLLEVADEVAAKYAEQARTLPLQWYFAALKIVNDTDFAFRTATNKQILVELMLIRLCQLLNPPTAPFDRVDNEPPLKMPTPVSQSTSIPGQENIPKSGTVATPTVTPESSPVSNHAPDPKASDPEPRSEDKSPARKSMRLSDLEAEYEDDRAARKDRRNPIEEESLMKVWNQYVYANADKGILVGAMKATVPVKIAEDEYLVKVAHPAQEQAFHTYMSHLLKSLRDSLENDFFSLKVEIDVNSDLKKPMPVKDLFQDIVSSNSTIANLAKTLDVEII